MIHVLKIHLETGACLIFRNHYVGTKQNGEWTDVYSGGRNNPAGSVVAAVRSDRILYMSFDNEPD